MSYLTIRDDRRELSSQDLYNSPSSLTRSIFVATIFSSRRVFRAKRVSRENSKEKRMRLTKPPQEMTFEDLTARQLEIAKLVAEGLGAAEVAKTLNLAYETVTNHMQSIADKVLADGGPRRRVRLGIALWVIKNDPRSEMKQSADSMTHQSS